MFIPFKNPNDNPNIITSDDHDMYAYENPDSRPLEVIPHISIPTSLERSCSHASLEDQCSTNKVKNDGENLIKVLSGDSTNMDVEGGVHVHNESAIETLEDATK
ncbi:hypothetical protein V6N13_125257 [Hibiscus sabdariffa]|uniref:Uncharacterized protein n=1 Tax=Hibiscus sabdariffa TaxID=183260 RepID=A0ABR2U5I3_9ROSI